MLTRLLAASTAALALNAGAASADYTLHILHINDLHSRIEPVNKYDSTCSAEDDAEGKCFGGVARLKTLIDMKRAELEGQNVLVLDAGDQFQGSLMYTTYKGAAEAEFMEAIGFDAMAVGNHEFDDGPEGLAGFLDQVSFPVISGNLDLSGSNLLKGKVQNHVVLEVGGEKIGLISALATDTEETSSPGPNVVFQDEIDSLSADAAALEAEGVTKIIALNHVGASRDFKIAEAVPGLDAVISSHSHTLFGNDNDKASYPYPVMVGNVPVVQAYAYSQYLGHLVLTFDDAGAVTSATGNTIRVDGSIAPDPAVAARVAELAGPIEEIKTKVVAEAAELIDGERDACRSRECAMGNLVADAMLDRVRDQGIQIALQNGGGLRASIPAGPVTMGQVYTVLPFQNSLATFQVKGSVLKDALENGMRQYDDPDKNGRFPQVSGMKYAIDATKPFGERISGMMVMEGDAWVPIEPDKVYGVVSNNYVRNGGDGYDVFETEAMNVYDFGPNLAEVLAEYMAKQDGYQPYLDGRISQ